MTREDAKEYLMNISYQLGTMSIEYLSERDGEKMREAIEALEQEPCEDAISRKDALFAVRVGILSTATVYGRSEEGMATRREIEGALKALPPVNPAEKVGKWIPVSERLPERWQLVNITIKDYDESLLTGVGYYRGNDDGTWFITAGDGEFLADDEVTAWTPLPEPYKVESEGEQNEDDN